MTARSSLQPPPSLQQLGPELIIDFDESPKELPLVGD